MNGVHESRSIVKYLVDKRELNELYISIVLRSLAFSMIGIFVPLFLFRELSYSLTQLCYYYILYSIVFVIFTPMGASLGSRFGIKHIILLSLPFYITYFSLLYFLKIEPIFFFIIPIIYGIADGIFWINFHIDFSTFSQKKERGNQVGRYYRFALLAGLVGPVIGGVVLTFSTFNTLFIIVSLLLMGSAVPLFFTKDIKKDYKFSYNFLKAGSFKDFVSFVAAGGKIITESVFWPIFIFTILGFYAAIGSLFTLLGFISILLTYVIGKLSDIFDKRKMIRWFSVLHSITWFLNVFIKTKLELVAIATVVNISAIGMELPYNALMYNKGGKHVEYFIFRELGLGVGRILVLLLVLATNSLLSSFFYAAVASLGFMLL